MYELMRIDSPPALLQGLVQGLISDTGICLLLTGLSGAGKSTLAHSLERLLREKNTPTVVLDGDVIRAGLCRDLGMSLADRQENARRVAEVAKILVESGVAVIVSMIAPSKQSRMIMRDVVGIDAFREVYISTPLAVCEQRDVKGLYQKARLGLLSNFTGLDSPYEPPESPVMVLDLSSGDVDYFAQGVISNVFEK
ncbi:MAG: adenylyl-sulfate kinase [Pseudomonadota bacterium]